MGPSARSLPGTTPAVHLRAPSQLKARVTHSNSDFSLLSCGLASYNIHFDSTRTAVLNLTSENYSTPQKKTFSPVPLHLSLQAMAWESVFLTSAFGSFYNEARLRNHVVEYSLWFLKINVIKTLTLNLVALNTKIEVALRKYNCKQTIATQFKLQMQSRLWSGIRSDLTSDWVWRKL